MRVWSFQDKDSLSVLKDCVWNKFSFQEHNTRRDDIQFAKQVRVKDPKGRIVSVEKLPVYGYVKLPANGDKLLNLRVLLQQYRHLFSIYEQSLLNKVMFEMEVPDADILLLRNLSNTDIVAYGDFMRHVREADEESAYEILVPEIRKEWIASYYVFSAMHQHDGVIASPKVVDSSLSPMCLEDIYIVNDGNSYYTDSIGNIVKSNYFNIDDLVGSVGAQTCPEYFTIEEALRYCNTKYQDELIRLCKKFGVFKSKYGSVTIAELNNKSKTLDDMDNLFGGI